MAIQYPFGRREALTELRKQAKLSQAALARKIGTNQQRIDRIERGQSPSLHVGLSIASFFNTPINELFPDIPVPTGFTISEKPYVPIVQSAPSKPVSNHWNMQIDFDAGQRVTIHIDEKTKEEVLPYLGDTEGLLQTDIKGVRWIINMRHVASLKMGPASREHEAIETLQPPLGSIVLIVTSELKPMTMKPKNFDKDTLRLILETPKIVLEASSGEVLSMRAENVSLLGISL